MRARLLSTLCAAILIAAFSVPGAALAGLTFGGGATVDRQSATNCPGESGGTTAEVCQQLDTNAFYVCETGPCDASGWVVYGGGAADNLGNHTATELLDLATFEIINQGGTGYDFVLLLDDASTASSDWATAFGPYMSMQAVPGARRAMVVYDLIGAEELVIESHCYDESGVWPYRVCFMWHPVQLDSDFNGVYPDSLGSTRANAPNATGVTARTMDISHFGRVEVDQDSVNMTKNAAVWEFGNHWMTGAQILDSEQEAPVAIGSLPGTGNVNLDYHVNDAVDVLDCTTGGGSVETNCVWSRSSLIYMAGGTGEVDAISTVGHTVNNRGHVTFRNADALSTGTGQGLPNMSSLHRFNEQSVSTLVTVAYNGGSYVNSGHWVIHAMQGDNDDIQFHNLFSWGNVPPSYQVISGDGYGAVLHNNPNMAESWTAGFRQLDYGFIFGDPVYGDSVGNYENCAAPDMTDLGAGISGLCVSQSLGVNGVNLEASMSEGNTYGFGVFIVPTSRVLINAYMEGGTSVDLKGISFGPYFCNGDGTGNVLPKNTPVQEISHCADSGATGQLAPWFAENGDNYLEFNSWNWSTSQAATSSYPILIGPGLHDRQHIVLDGYLALADQVTTNEEFVVSAAVDIDNGPMIFMKSPWKYDDYTSSGSLSQISDYFNFRIINEENTSEFTEAISWKAPVAGDDVFFYRRHNQYVESIGCLALGGSTPTGATVSVHICNDVGASCSAVAGATVSPSALGTRYVGTATLPVRVIQGETVKVDMAITTSPDFMHCEVGMHK